jgi:hypothetical protein
MRLPLGLAGLALLAAPSAAPAQSYRTLVESRRLDRKEAIHVTVSFAVGRFRLVPASTAELYRVGLTYLDEQFEPDVSYDPREGRLEIDLDGRRERDVHVKDLEDTRQRLDLALSPEVPLHLDLTFGAVQAEVELGGLTLQSASLETGASETVVRFSEPNRAACDDLTMQVGAAEFEVIGLGNSRCRSLDLKGGVGEITLDFSGDWAPGAEMRVSADVGLGDVHLRVPESVGVRLNVDRFLVSLQLDGFTKRGSTWYSAGYDRASVKLLMDVNAAFGSIEVDWIK